MSGTPLTKLLHDGNVQVGTSGMHRTQPVELPVFGCAAINMAI